MNQALRTQDVLIDIGANEGYFTVLQAVRGVRVHAFEPSPHNLQILSRNVELNHIQSLVTIHSSGCCRRYQW